MSPRWPGDPTRRGNSGQPFSSPFDPAGPAGPAKELRADDAGHRPDHFFKGVCICHCGVCTLHLVTYTIKCICPDCDPLKCGARTLPVAG